MNKVSSRRAQRAGVVVIYVSALALSAVACWGEYTVWTAPVSFLALLLLAALLGSVHFTLIRTGFWRLTHTSVEELDEREVQITHNSLRHAYGLLSRVSFVLVLFMVISVRFSFLTLTHRGHYSLGLAILILIQIFIHTLPASFLAWTEKSMD